MKLICLSIGTEMCSILHRPIVQECYGNNPFDGHILEASAPPKATIASPDYIFASFAATPDSMWLGQMWKLVAFSSLGQTVLKIFNAAITPLHYSREVEYAMGYKVVTAWLPIYQVKRFSRLDNADAVLPVYFRTSKLSKWKALSIMPR